MTTERPKSKSPKSLTGLLPFLRPYGARIGLALVFLVMVMQVLILFGLKRPD